MYPPPNCGKIPKKKNRQINKTTMYEYNVKNWRAFLSTIISSPFCTYAHTQIHIHIRSTFATLNFAVFFSNRMIRAIYQFLDFHRFHANYKHIHATTFVWFTFWVEWFPYFHSKMYVDSKINTQQNLKNPQSRENSIRFHLFLLHKKRFFYFYFI